MDAGDDRRQKNWHYRLSPESVEALERAVLAHRQSLSPVTELSPSPELCRLLQVDLQPVRRALEWGRGFAIQDGPDLSRYSLEEATAMYWVFGQCLGTPVIQNVQGALLYDVRDTGQSVKDGVRFSVTNADSSYHTDNSFGAHVTDYVGLLCLRSARSGGVNHLVSAWPIYDLLAREYPEGLAVLSRSFPVERRGGFREGESPVIHQPVVEKQGGELLFRYLRYWIETGAGKAERPLAEAQVRALDVLDQLLRRPELRVEFSLEAGQILWVNNRWLLHSRTAFEDHDEPARRRHLIRLWLEARN